LYSALSIGEERYINKVIIIISNEAWHEFSAKAKDFPKFSNLTERVNKLNTSWTLSPTPGEAEGVQVTFENSP